MAPLLLPQPPPDLTLCAAMSAAAVYLDAEPSLALSVIERPASAPDGGHALAPKADVDGTLSMVALPPVIDKHLSIEWDVDKVPQGRVQSLGLEERSHLAKCKIVQQYQTIQQPAARALKEQSMLASPTATSRAAATLEPARVEHHRHPLNESWTQERADRVDRLSTPTPVRLRQVTQRRGKAKLDMAAPATAFSAHTAVAAAKIYASSHKGWQSRKTPYRKQQQKQQQQQQRRLQQLEAESIAAAPPSPSYPVEWEPRIETLLSQFKADFHRAEIVEAMIHMDGHAGKVARILRGGISDAAFSSSGGGGGAGGDGPSAPATPTPT